MVTPGDEGCKPVVRGSYSQLPQKCPISLEPFVYKIQVSEFGGVWLLVNRLVSLDQSKSRKERC